MKNTKVLNASQFDASLNVSQNYFIIVFKKRIEIQIYNGKSTTFSAPS